MNQKLTKNNSFIRYNTQTKNISHFSPNIKKNLNESLINKSLNNISSENNIFNKIMIIPNNNSSQIKVLKGKLKEKNSEIEKLKILLSKEKESKISFMDELNKLKFSTSNKNIINKNKQIISFKSKINDTN